MTEACPRNGKITSLSLRGCFIKTTANVTDGQIIFVNCWLPSRRWALFRATVIYHLTKIGFGLIFMELDEEQQETIRSLIEHYKEKQAK